MGLRVPGVLGDIGEGGVPVTGVDRTPKPGSAAQRFRDAVASRVLCGLGSQKQDTTCPKLSGAVHLLNPVTDSGGSPASDSRDTPHLNETSDPSQTRRAARDNSSQ